MKQFFSPMPDPKEKHPAPLRPHQRIEGIYRLHRLPLDTEVTWEEPTGNSYQLEFFECERALKSILQIEEDYVNTILDRVWNFHHISFDVDNPRHIVNLRDPECRRHTYTD